MVNYEPHHFYEDAEGRLWHYTSHGRPADGSEPHVQWFPVGHTGGWTTVPHPAEPLRLAYDPEGKRVPQDALEVPGQLGWVSFQVEVIPQEWANDGQAWHRGRLPAVDAAAVLRGIADECERYWSHGVGSLRGVAMCRHDDGTEHPSNGDLPCPTYLPYAPRNLGGSADPATYEPSDTTRYRCPACGASWLGPSVCPECENAAVERVAAP